MKSLKESAFYTVDEDTLYDKAPEFLGYSCTEAETKDTIDNFYDDYSYLLDPHTAVGVTAFFKYLNEVYDDTTPSIVVSTANPYKFPQSVLEASCHVKEDDALKAAKRLSRATSTLIPEAIASLDEKPVLHDLVVSKEEIPDAVLSFVGGKK